MNWRDLREKLKWKGWNSIEFRFLGLLVRVLGAFVFCIYLTTNGSRARTWAEAKWVRTQPLSRLDSVLADAKASGNYAWAEKWVKYRPFPESAALIARAAPYSASMSPFFFFDLSDRADYLGDREQADLWNMIAHYRMRFDLLRCGLSNGIEQGHKLVDLLAMVHGNFYRDIRPEERIPLARKVLEFDAKYPATDDPEPLCRILPAAAGVDYRILPREDWEPFRQGLRESTEINLKIETRKNLKKSLKDKKK